MAILRLTEDGELTVFTSEGNHIGRVDLSDAETCDAMRDVLERFKTEHIDRPKKR